MADVGVERAALLLLSLGESCAEKIIRHLDPNQVKKLGMKISAVKDLKTGDYEGVFNKLLFEINESLKPNGARENSSVAVEGIEKLKNFESRKIALLLQSEHPQVIASLLMHFKSSKIAEVLPHFEKSLQVNILLRMCQMDGIRETVSQWLDELINKNLLAQMDNQIKSANGVEFVADILNLLSEDVEPELFKAMKESAPALKQELLHAMSTFEGLFKLDDSSFKTLLKKTPIMTLVTALQGTSTKHKNKVFLSLAKQDSIILKKRLEANRPLQVFEIEQAQQDLLKIAQRMIENEHGKNQAAMCLTLSRQCD